MLGLIAGVLAVGVTDSVLSLALIGTSIGLTAAKVAVIASSLFVGFIVWAVAWAQSFPRSG